MTDSLYTYSLCWQNRLTWLKISRKSQSHESCKTTAEIMWRKPVNFSNIPFEGFTKKHVIFKLVNTKIAISRKYHRAVVRTKEEVLLLPINRLSDWRTTQLSERRRRFYLPWIIGFLTGAKKVVCLVYLYKLFSMMLLSKCLIQIRYWIFILLEEYT